MKINKRVLSICLAVMLVAALAIPASASYYYDYGEYDGGTYEVSDTCNYFDFSSVTTYDGPAYMLKSDVDVYGTGISGGNTADELLTRITGTPTAGINSTSARDFGTVLRRIICHHYINNVYVYNTNVVSG